MNKTFEYCKHRGHLINQGIHWCGKQVKGYPECCNEKCPYYEAVDLGTITTTSTTFVEVDNEKNSINKTNKKRKKRM